MTVTIATPVKMHRLTILSEKRTSFKLLSRIGDLIFFFLNKGCTYEYSGCGDLKRKQLGS